MTQYNDYTYNNNSMTFRAFLSKVFSTMAIGLLISGVVAFLVNVNLYKLMGYSGFSTFVLVALIGELVVGILFSARLFKMSKSACWACYIAYSCLTGLSLALIISGYTTGSVVFAFISTVIMFACMAVIGHNSRVDLTSFSTYFMAGLVAIIITSLLNMLFFKSEGINYLITIVGVIIFLGLIAYDMQKLRTFYERGSLDSEFQEKMMLYGAFSLYLDFINLFIRVLQIFGRSSNRRD